MRLRGIPKPAALLICALVSAGFQLGTASAEPRYSFSAHTDGLPATSIAGVWAPSPETPLRWTLAVAGAHVVSKSRFEARWTSDFTEPRKTASLSVAPVLIRADPLDGVSMVHSMRYRCKGCPWSDWERQPDLFVMPIGATIWDGLSIESSSRRNRSWQFEWKAVGKVDQATAFASKVDLVIR